MPLSSAVGPDALPLCGQPVTAVTFDGAAELLAARAEAGQTTRVAFLNSNLVVALQRYGGVRSILAGFRVFNDGLAADAACLLVHRRMYPSNLNGTDLTPAFLSRLPSGRRVFLYGARQHVVSRMAKRVSEEFGHDVVGAYDGFSYDPAAMHELAVAARPDVVLVGLGNPAQELWIRDYPAGTEGPVIMGVGALFDFMTGEAVRAPLAFRKARLEWLYRLIREPRRLARRYTVDMLLFFWYALRQSRPNDRRGGSARLV
jgi:beta-1,4-glucosyltransferase